MGMENLYEYRIRLIERIAGADAKLENMVRASGEYPPGILHDQRIVLAHLRDMERYEYLPALRRILESDRPYLDAYDWRKGSLSPGDTVDSLLSEYLSLREEQRALITSNTQPGWSCIGRHPVWGLRTFQWWVERSLSHLQKHLHQYQDEHKFHD